MPPIHAVTAFRSLSFTLCVAATLLGTTPVAAAGRSNLSEAQRTYQNDRAACLSGRTHQDRATCLREAGAALQAAKHGGLDDGGQQFERNRLLRCDRQPAEDRADCVRRMNGEGFTSGSVEGGGIYRELVTPVNPAQRN